MKQLNRYITEKLVINKDTQDSKEYKYTPKNRWELMGIIDKLLEERGPNANLNDIDVSHIDDLAQVFKNNKHHKIYNIDISEWDVSNATDMAEMFSGCKDVNCDLSSWKVDNVKSFVRMFSGCKNFEGIGLEKWNPIHVTHTTQMFWECESLNCNLSQWHLDDLKYMPDMFYNCKTLEKNGLIPDWYDNNYERP